MARIAAAVGKAEPQLFPQWRQGQGEGMQEGP
jgi:hypothetical protein